MKWMISSPRRLLLIAVAVVLIALGAGVLLVSRANDGSREIESYVFTAHIEANAGVLGEDDDVLDTIRAWYAAPDRWRFEFGDFEAGDKNGASLQASDGESVWSYNVDTNTYTVQPLQTYFRGIPAEYRSPLSFLAFSVPIGPLPGGDRESFLAALVESGTQEARTDGPEIIGRKTELLTDASGPTATIRLWVDREYAFVLRYEARDESVGYSIQAEITEVAFNIPIDPALLAFTLPAAALEVEESGSSQGSGSVGVGPGLVFSDSPEGFLTPGYLPNGYAVTGSSSGGSNGIDTTTFGVHLETADGSAYLDIDQRFRAGGMADRQRSGDPVPVGDSEGYLRIEVDETTLIWSNGDIVITLHSNTLTQAELLRVAESMRRAE